MWKINGIMRQKDVEMFINLRNVTIFMMFLDKLVKPTIMQLTSPSGLCRNTCTLEGILF